MSTDSQLNPVIHHCQDGKDKSEEDILRYHCKETIFLNFRVKSVHKSEKNRCHNDGKPSVARGNGETLHKISSEDELFKPCLKRYRYPVSYTHLTLPTNREV